MNYNRNTKYLLHIGVFLILEVLSYFSLDFNFLSPLLLVLIFALTLFFSFFKLEYALLVAIGELLIGAMGHMFVFNMGDVSISVRMLIWLAIMSSFTCQFAYQLIKDKQQSEFLESIINFRLIKYFLLLALFVFAGAISAYYHGNKSTYIFSDINSWLYFLLIFPAIAVYSRPDKDRRDRLKTIFTAGAVWLSLKTLVLLYIFTHSLSVAPDIYTWLRRTIAAEITPTLSGWPRIFIQGQIFSGLAYFFALFLNIDRQKNFKSLLLSGLFFSSVLISFSRSFWAAFLATTILCLLLIWRRYAGRKVLTSIAWLTGTALIAFTFIYLTSVFPFPTPGRFNADFINRASNSNESAIASRWSLLPVLMRGISKEPFLGQGFGTTITYISSDPRVLEKNPTGEYTTYAFEWGYLDICLKIGALGLAAYLLLIILMIIRGIKYGFRHNDHWQFGLASAIFFLAVTNFFTPYLNHPLGIGILVIGSCLIQKDRVY